MENIHKILVAVGFSEYCPRTFEMAVSLARKYDSTLVAVHVINVRAVEAVSSVESMGYPVSSVDYIKSVEQERLEELKRYVRDTGCSEKRVKIVLRVGNPFDQIMKVIREEQVDLVVMGTQGRSNLPNVLVGSVAEKIFRHSPVTVVSNRERRPRA